MLLKSFIKKSVLDNTELMLINVNNPSNYLDINNIYFGGNIFEKSRQFG